MYIEGRKSKPYSEKLYNELLLLVMFISSDDDLPSYILNNTFHKSARTYRRYFKELHDCGLIPEIISRRSKNLKGEFNYTIPYEIEDMEIYYYEFSKSYFVDVSDALLRHLRKYSKEHFNPSDRLFRCGRIILSSYNDCYWDDTYYLEDDGSDDLDLSNLDMTNTYLVGNMFYHVELSGYDDLYDGLSLRSRQRDLKLVKQAVLDALVLSDKFG